MRGLRSSLLAVALCAAASAHAQAIAAEPVTQPPVTQQPVAQQPAAQQAPQPQSQRGFFPPTPGDDPSLFRTLPPEAYVQPSATPRAAQANAEPARATPPLVVMVPDPNLETREENERSRIEAQQAAARMAQVPAPINGAFTGATDEADRR